MSAAAIVAQVRISDVWAWLGGPPLRHGRGCAFWRGSRDGNVSLDDIKGVWYDNVTHVGGGMLDLIRVVLQCSRREALQWLAERTGVTLDNEPPSAEERATWAAERRAIEQHLPAARLWRRAAVALGAGLVDQLKDGISSPAGILAEVGEVGQWTRRVTRWRRIDGGELVREYLSWRERNPEFIAAMVAAADRFSVAESRGLREWLSATEEEAA